MGQEQGRRNVAIKWVAISTVIGTLRWNAERGQVECRIFLATAEHKQPPNKFLTERDGKE